MISGCVLATTVAARVRAQDAPMFRGNLARTGIYAGPALTQLGGIKWKFHTEGKVLSSPAVVGGVAFVGSTDGNLYAIDANDGTLKWKFKTNARIPSSPAVANGVVYFASYDSFVYAVDATTGTLKWKFKTAGERRFAGRRLHGGVPEGETMPDQWDFFLSSPAVWRGTVYIGSGDGNVYALDADTGKPRWKFTTGNVVHASPSIADGTVFIGSWDSYFYALDATSGKLKWKLKTGVDTAVHNQEGFQGSAAVVDGVVYVGCRDSHVYAIDAKTGTKKWEVSAKGAWVSGSPSVRDGKVYVGTGDSSTLLVLEAATGKEIARLPFVWMIFGSPAVAGNMLYLGSMDGKLKAVDLGTNTVAWEFQTDSSRANLSKYTRPNGTMNYASTVSEPFYDDWAPRFLKIFSMGSFLSSPSVVDGIVYVGSTDGNLYALK